MQVAAYICFGLAGLCIAPFVVWFIIAIFFAMGEGLYQFIKTREPDKLFEFLSAFFLVSMAFGFILHYLANR